MKYLGKFLPEFWLPRPTRCLWKMFQIINLTTMLNNICIIKEAPKSIPGVATIMALPGPRGWGFVRFSSYQGQIEKKRLTYTTLISVKNWRIGLLSTAECNNQLPCLFSTICDFEEEIDKALITTKALLLYRPGEACGLLESIFQPIVQACGSFRLVVTFGSRE